MKPTAKHFTWGNIHTTPFYFITFLSVTFTLWFYWTPFMDDDFYYMMYFQDYINNKEGESLWSSFCHMLFDQWQKNNIRLPNIITSVTHTIIPKWFLSVILGICVWLILYWSSLLADSKNKSTSNYLIIAGIVLGLPWWANIAIPVYAQSYILSSTVSLGFLILWFSSKNKCNSIIKQLALLSMGIITGISHEGFSVPILCGILLYSCFNYKSINRQQIIMTLSLIVGIVIIMSAPGDIRTCPTLYRPINQWIYALVINSPITTIMLTIILIYCALSKNKFISFISHSHIILFIGISIASLFITIAAFPSHRSSWMGELSAIITIVYIINIISPIKQINRYVKIGVKYIIGTIIITHMLIVDIFALKCHEDYQFILMKYLSNPQKTIYFNYTSPRDIPIIACGKVISSYPWIGEYPLECLTKYHQTVHKPNVIHPSLRDFTTSKAKKIDGNNPFYFYNGTLIAPIDSIQWLERFTVDFRYPIDQSCGFATFPFKSNSGDSLVMATSWLFDRQLPYNPIISINKE